MDITNVALHKKNKAIVEIPNAHEPLLMSREENPKIMETLIRSKKCESSGSLPCYAPVPDDVEIDFEDDDEEPDTCSKYVNQVQEKLSEYWAKYCRNVKRFIVFLGVLGYSVYFVAALMHKFGDEASYRLIGMTTVVVLVKVIPILRKTIGGKLSKLSKPFMEFTENHASKINLLLLSTIYVAVVIVVIIDLTMYSSDMYNLVSLAGIVVYIVIMFIFSVKPSRVKWRTVLWGFGLQFAFSLMILRWSGGYEIFKWLGDRVYDVLGFLTAGCIFLFGPSYKDHFFAMQVLPFVIFISSLITILFYFGIMESMICKLAWVMQSTMGTTAGESVNAAGNIFIGQTESPLLIRPILHCMTDSEIHAMMTSGFATVAGGTLAAYILFGVPSNHLLSASVMSAPAALAISKIFYPETKKSLTTAMNVGQLMHKTSEKSFIEAAASGACFAVPLVANIAASLIAFISILEGLNASLIWFGDRVGSVRPITFQLICSYVLWPFALVMGIHMKDCGKVAQLIGIKTFINEFIAFESLSQLISNRKLLEQHIINNGSWMWSRDDIVLSHLNGSSTILENGVIEDRSVIITTYALCGFSNLCSIGVQIGAFSTLIPTRKSVVAKVAVRAMIAGNVACFVTACIAGLFYNPTR